MATFYAIVGLCRRLRASVYTDTVQLFGSSSAFTSMLMGLAGQYARIIINLKILVLMTKVLDVRKL